ncbi:MAG: rhodanese-like domain-containing protein [Desulfuromonadaceae bacterium]|nr:rhodanese-like domain-containing protein [Desulfuromonadaceae bacterium]MDD5105742.1 rhodanese-like domain-containing protein [Desulfuromonadaceae bacterium]
MTMKTLLFTVAASLTVATAFAADPAVPAASPAKPSMAKPCALCHKAEPNTVRGNFDLVTFKAKTIQVKIDDSVEQFKFDEDEIKVVNGAGKIGDGEFLKDNLVKKGHEVKVEYVEKDGVKTAVKLVEKPPVKISDDMLMKTADIEKLVALGPEKGKYFLFDSRPLPRFQDGSIPTAVNLPFPAFDKLAEKLLPKDKNALVIFFCQGVTCNMSPGSANKARKLGYTNIKVYKDGMPAWQEKHYGVLSPKFLKEAWIAKEIPHVLLDTRTEKEAAKGFIVGAVTFPAKKAAALAKKLDVKKNAPIIVYDQKGGKDAEKAANSLLKAGFKRVAMLTGGFEAWQADKYDVASGKLATKATYVSKPRPGEINLDEFKKYAVELPANVMLIDARTVTESKAGMIKTAKNIPAEELKDRQAEIPKDKLIVFYCNTGVIAEVAYNSLKSLGYTDVKFANAKVTFAKDGSYKISKE